MALLMLLLFGIGAGWYFGAMPLPEYFTGKADKDKLALIPQATVSIGYLATADRWLEFAVAPGVSHLKIVSNPTVMELERLRQLRTADPTLRWNIELEIEVLDKDGAPILKRSHHLRTDISEFRMPDGRTYTQAFFLRENLVPLSSAITAIDLGGLPAATRLRLRLAHKDADIHDVLVRVYQPERISEQRAAVAWKRMAERSKDALVKSSVYPAELLLENEIRNLLMSAMQPIGPRGAEGWDYHSRQLYVLFDNQGEVVDDPVPPAGVMTDAYMRATIPLPPEGGMVRLQLEPVSTSTLRHMVPGPVRDGESASIHWEGLSLFERQDTRIPLRSQGNTEFRQRFKGGLLEIVTPREMAVRAWLEKEGNPAPAPLEITPLPRYARLFAATPKEPIVFALAAREEASVVRIELRRVLATADDSDTRTRFEILDSDGNILHEGKISQPLLASHYERVVGDYSGAWLSDPVLFHLLLPRNARAVRLWDDRVAADPQRPLLVAADTRPYRLGREIRVPEDNFDFDANGKRIPAWFLLQPEDYEGLMLSNRTRLVLTQTRPAQVKPEIVAGHYQWQNLRPLEPGLARPILGPREAGSPFREDILPSVFTPLPMNRWLDVDLPAYQGMQTVTPTLVWIGADNAVSLTLDMDGAPSLPLRLAGPYAEWTLPPLATGRRRIRVQGPSDGQVLLNHLRPGPQALLRRLGQRFDTRMRFDYERTEAVEETLTLRLFQAAGTRAPATLEVHVDGPRPPEFAPMSGWVFDQRQLIVTPDTSFAAPIFDTTGQRSDAGQPMYLPFLADAPRGRYRITVTAKPGTVGYLAMSRLGPETQPRRRLHLETELRHDPTPE